MTSESPRGRARSRSQYSDVSKGRGDFRSTSRPRRSITPRSVSRSPRRNGRYRNESRSVSRGRSPSPVRSTKVVIEKLTKNVNESHLREIFGTFGQIRDLDMPMNRSFNTNRGTAYILYTSESHAEAAIAHMHESQIDGAVINVSIVLPRRKFSPSPPLARRTVNLDPRAPIAAAPRMIETRIRTDHDLSHGPDHQDVTAHAQDHSHRGLDRHLDEDEVVEVEEQEDVEIARDGMVVEEGEVSVIAATAVMTTGAEAEAVDEEEGVADVKCTTNFYRRWSLGQPVNMCC
ncbi:RNA recognition domain-containing protein [Diplocarpon rosae]|nr:RNA recognition domain-containing protein [Diplocarpon rosae]